MVYSLLMEDKDMGGYTWKDRGNIWREFNKVMSGDGSMEVAKLEASLSNSL